MSICHHNRINCIRCNPPKPPPIRVLKEDIEPPTSEELFSEWEAPWGTDFLRTLVIGIVIGFLVGLIF